MAGALESRTSECFASSLAWVMAAFREFGMPLIKRVPDERGFFCAPPRGAKVTIQMLLKLSGLLSLAGDLRGVWQ
jgi:hypothetical protein